MTDIDFTQWTDAQLDSGLTVARRFGSPSLAAMQAEADRRHNAPSDGSHERVAELIRNNQRKR